jgi:hypothetical protein
MGLALFILFILGILESVLMVRLTALQRAV